jgi:hypothetical protein
MATPIFPSGIQGLSDSKWAGTAGSAYRLIGVDYRQTPGIVRAQQALVKESGTTVTELCKERVRCSDGSNLWFSSESGKIWREVSGTYTLVHTTVPTTGTAPCTGAHEYDGDVYWATEDYVHKIAVSGLGDTWSDVAQVNWGLFKNGTTGIEHPMVVQNLKLLIADGTDIAYVETPDVNPTPPAVSSVSFSASVGGIMQDVLITPPTGATHYPQFIKADYINVNSASSGTKSFTVPPGSNRAIIVYVTAWREDNVTPTNPTGVTFDGVSMTSQGGSSYFSGAIGTGRMVTDTYSLVAPSVKTANVVVTWSGTESASRAVNILLFNNVRQSSPLSGGGDVNTTGATSLSRTATTLTKYNTKLVRSRTRTATHTNSDVQVQSEETNNGRVSIAVSTVGAGSFNNETNFKVRQPETITALTPFDIDVLVGTRNVNKARVLRWDTYNDSWSAEDDVDEKGVNAFIKDDNFVYASIGEHGRLYFYNGEKMEPYKRIPGEWSPTATAVVNASSVGFLLGVPVFGLSNTAGNPTLQGVYGFGAYSRDYNKTLSLDFPTPSTTFAGLTIGGIITDGANMWVAYKDASNVGIAKLSYTTKYNGAYIETTMLIPSTKRSDISSVSRYFVDYVSLPASTGVTIGIKTKYDTTYTTLTQKNDIIRMQIRADHSTPQIANLQIRYTFTTNANNSPEIENFAIS